MILTSLVTLRCVHHYVFKNRISNLFALILSTTSFIGDIYVYENIDWTRVDVLSPSESNDMFALQYNLHMSFYIYTMFYMCKSRSIELHHIVTMMCCASAYFAGYHHAMSFVFWATSISTPFLNLHYICKDNGKKTLSLLNFIIFFGCFLYFRVYALATRVISPMFHIQLDGSLSNSAKYTLTIIYLINFYWIYKIMKKIKNEYLFRETL